MPRLVSEPSDDVTVYLVLNDYKTGLAYVETAPAEADRETIIRNFLSGQYANALRVVAFNAAEGWSRDVSEDIAGEVLERAFDADDNLLEGTNVHRPAFDPWRKAAAGAIGATRRRSSGSKGWRVAGSEWALGKPSRGRICSFITLSTLHNIL
jgi:hypothetical protein